MSFVPKQISQKDQMAYISKLAGTNTMLWLSMVIGLVIGLIHGAVFEDKLRTILPDYNFGAVYVIVDIVFAFIWYQIWYNMTGEIRRKKTIAMKDKIVTAAEQRAITNFAFGWTVLGLLVLGGYFMATWGIIRYGILHEPYGDAIHWAYELCFGAGILMITLILGSQSSKKLDNLVRQIRTLRYQPRPQEQK